MHLRTITNLSDLILPEINHSTNNEPSPFFTPNTVIHQSITSIAYAVLLINSNTGQSLFPFVENFRQRRREAIQDPLEKAAFILEVELQDAGKLLKNDPLTIQEGLKIKEFLDRFFLKSQPDTLYAYGDKPDGFVKNVCHQPATIRKLNQFINDPKKYANNLQEAFDVFPLKDFDTVKLKDLFSVTVQDLSLLGIDQDNYGKYFAAKMFIKAYISTYSTLSYNTFSFKDVYLEYCRKMGNDQDDKPRFQISCKNHMLIQNDPVQPLPTIFRPSSVDHILANCYFQTPDGLSRESARSRISTILTLLSSTPHIPLIFDVLEALILKENANFFFSKEINNIQQLAKPYGISDTTYGLYRHGHSTYSISLLNSNGSTNKEGVGAFIHEALHFIFKVLVGHGCSPVKPNTSEADLFQKALLKDLELHDTLQRESLSDNQKELYDLFVSVFQDGTSYFNGERFDRNNPIHLRKYGNEMIVRIIQAVAMDLSPELLAPKTWLFYLDVVVPMFKKYIQLSKSNVQMNEPNNFDLPVD